MISHSWDAFTTSSALLTEDTPVLPREGTRDRATIVGRPYLSATPPDGTHTRFSRPATVSVGLGASIPGEAMMTQPSLITHVRSPTGLATVSRGQGPSFPVEAMKTQPLSIHTSQSGVQDRGCPSGPAAVSRGQVLAVSMGQATTASAVQELRGTLIGQLIYKKKVTSLSVDKLERKLTKLWGTSGAWRLIPLGKGYFNIRFSSREDRDRVFKCRTWSVKLGVMRLQHWVPGFDPEKITSSVTQVWIRLYGLPMEYWQTQVLWAMASIIGTPIMIDKRTKNQSMCYYARVLVELDLKLSREERIMFERAGHSSFAKVKYEQLPEFCVACGIIGHVVTNCRRHVGRDSAPGPTVVSPHKGTNTEWVRKGPVTP
ncbi:hypothetical protein ACS0TY_010820 [Phlomoides rotata]